jgi:hypothetical protein
MASPRKEREEHVEEEQAPDVAHMDAAHREAYEYWGYLFKKDKCGTPLLDRLLKGIAEVIVSGGQLQDERLLGHVRADACCCRARSSSQAIRPTSRHRKSPPGTVALAGTTTSSSKKRRPRPLHSYIARSAHFTAYSPDPTTMATRLLSYPR